MNHKVFNEEYNIVFKESINVVDKFKYLLTNKNTLIVKIQGKQEEFYNIDKNLLYTTIDKYIEDNRFSNINIVEFDELLKLSSELENKNYKVLKKLNIKKYIEKFNDSKFINFMVPIIGLLVAYFFYQLGYSFLYGFYFGGNIDEYISLIDMIINPVPFNFKSITVIGFLYSMTLIAYLIPLFLSIRENKIIKKFRYLIIYIFIILIIFTFISVMFWGMSNEIFQRGIYLLILLLSIPVIAVLAVSFFRLLYSNTVLFFSVLIYFLILTYIVFDFFEIIDESYLIVASLVITTFIISFGKIIVYKFEDFFKLKVVVFLGQIILHMPYLFLLIAIVLSIFKLKFNLICFVFMLIFTVIFVFSKNTIQKSKVFNRKNTENNSPIDISENKRDSKRDLPIICCYILISILSLCSMMIYLTTIAGRVISYTAEINSKDMIVYNSIDNSRESKLIFGSVVAQTDNVYFISKYPGRKLVTIKDLNIQTYPCKKYDINDIILKKYKNKISQLGYNLNESNSESNTSFKYTSNTKSNDEALFQIEYSLDENGDIKEFRFGVVETFQENYLENVSRYRNKAIDKLMDYSIEYFNIPKFAFEKQSQFFYSNGHIEYIRNEKYNKHYEYYIFRKK